MAEKVRDKFARGIYVVSKDGLFSELITYEYEDPDGYYSSLTKSELEATLSGFKKGMEEALKEERILVNGSEVKPKVKSVTMTHPYGTRRVDVTFFIQFRAKLGKDNSYENIYESGVATYNFEALWLFPPRTKIIEVRSSGVVEKLASNIVKIFGWKGMKYDGYDMIRFQF